jgi:hypothetical protein
MKVTAIMPIPFTTHSTGAYRAPTHSAMTAAISTAMLAMPNTTAIHESDMLESGSTATQTVYAATNATAVATRSHPPMRMRRGYARTRPQ